MTTTECRAKDPSTCWKHGSVSAESMYQSYVSSTLVRKEPATHPVSAAGVFSSSWTGKAPKWWKKYESKAMADEQLPTKPELIDIIDSPAGPLAVVWQNESQADNDRSVTMSSGMGVSVCYYKSVKTGETLGYVKMTSMNPESFERSFGNDEFTPFRYMSRYSGSRYGFEGGWDEPYGNRNLTGEELLQKRREVWVKAQNNLGRGLYTEDKEYVSAVNVSARHLPDDKTVAKDLKEFAAPVKKEMTNKRTYFKTPYVDYSKVEEPLKGKGFGAALYVYTAKKLGENGQVLRGSGIQSDDAQALWSRFTTKFPKNISSIKLNYMGEKSIAPILDFRV